MKFYFTWMDIIMPIGTAVLATLLSVWAAFKAKQKSAKIVCAITAIVFILSVPGWYWVRAHGLLPDYTTSQKVSVVQGKKNKCLKQDVEEWTQWTFDFWIKHLPEYCIRHAFETSIGVCRDEPALTAIGQWVRGYASGEVFYITWHNNKISRGLWIHELSHHVLDRCEKHWIEPYRKYGNQTHHTYMKEMGLGQ